METNLAEQLAEVQAARRALALEAETSAAAHHRDLEGLAISALELQTVLQELSREKVHRLASTDLTAARRRLSELNMELLLAQADAERGGHKEKGVPEAEMERSQADEALGKRKAQALEALKAAKASVQIYEDCCQELRSELSAAQVIDEDGDTLVISHCESLRAASSPDYATCRWAAGRLGRSFHFGAASPGCHLSASSTVTFNGSDLPSDIGTSICLKKRHSRSKNSARMTLRLPQAQQRGLKLFCFAWTTWKSRDVALLPDVRHAFQQCDGYRIFSDRQPAEEVENLVKVKVPEQDVQPKDEKWLYHRNMAGLMPSWDYLLKEEAEKYDWFVNVEFDHLLLTSKLRVSIATYLSLLEEGNPEQRQDAKGPLMLMFGNAFVFNHLMVKDMKRQWDHLGATAPAGHPASGCPTFMEGRFEWPRACSQDIVYPNLVTFMDPPVPAYGSPGCGQKPQDFPLACFEIQRQPVRDLGLDQISLVQHLATGEVVLADAKEVPLIHHLSDPAARKLARDLLD